MENSASLYNDDFVAWAEQQAGAVRSLAQRPDLSNALDWDHLAEEIETLGRSLVRAVERKLTLILVHLLKTLSAPDTPPARLWHAEIVTFQIAAFRNYMPSMRQRIDMQALWNDAQREADAALVAYGDALVRGLPQRCPFALDDLIRPDFEAGKALEALALSLHDRKAAD